MFTTKSECQNVVSKLILSEALLGIFGVAVLILMLFFAFAGMASEPNKQLNAMASPSKVADSGLMARNMKSGRESGWAGNLSAPQPSTFNSLIRR